MKRRKWWRWLVAIPLVPVAIFGWAALARGSDDYPFLQAHRTIEVGVLGPGSWPAKEIRLYTWKQPWTEVAKSAEADLTQSGLKSRKPRKGSKDQLEWTSEVIDGGPCGKDASTWVTVAKGRATPLRSAGAWSDGDPGWVTVIVRVDLDETWMNVIRYTFFGLR